ncbi:sulfatase-like hydrolase/transferase [uncultured Draconibacterium sp.]|uniref:sulfatase-like hydrolase/transferase n=1 Tax=uncultured Draconibacterium sp. TaxID=1573823 RepID=UPI003747C2B3
MRLLAVATVPFIFVGISIVFSLLNSCSSSETNKTDVPQPNVLIILADDLGYGDISCYNPKSTPTPQIDNLAENGILCTDFYVPTPYCAPSRATLLTGRFPLRHGLVKNPTPDAGINDIGIGAEEITLAEVFKESGYATKCIGKWHLGHKEEFFPVNHGFDEYYGILYSNDMRPVQLVENKDTVEYPVDQSQLTKRYTEKAIDFIERNKEQPFFLHLCHAMPHKPLAASERFYTPKTPNDLYTDVIKELDWSVGEVMNTLKELDILDNTIVIFMSDNGPWYGGNTGGLKGMKATTWEGGIRVPFILNYKKEFPEKTKVDVPCASVDVYPTLLALTGIRPIENYTIDGQDISQILKGKETEHGAVYSMHNEHITTVRKDDWKLFVREPKYKRLSKDWIDPRGPDRETILAPIIGQAGPADYPGLLPSKPEKEIQLFNLKADPSEDNDLSDENAEIVKELMDEYKRFEASFN